MINNCDVNINVENGSISMLNGERSGFDPRSRSVMRMSKTPDFESVDFKEKILPSMIAYHKQYILPRYETLLRYYLAQNDILYRESKTGFNVVDNRIASAKARNAVIFGVGYMYNKPVSFRNQNSKCEEKIEAFMKETNAGQYFTDMEKQQLIYGTAFGLISMDQFDYDKLVNCETKTRMRQTLDALNPMSTFVVYDYSLRPQSLFAVNYNTIDDSWVLTEEKAYTVANVYARENDYVYSNISGAYETIDVSENPYNAVRVTQWDNDPDRLGIYELALDMIDAYDLSQSELANFQQISNSPLLKIKNAQYAGNTVVYKKDEDGELTDEIDEVATARLKGQIEQQMMNANILAINDTVLPDSNGDGKSTVLTADAAYLVPVYDTTGTDAYKNRLESDMYDATMQPNLSDTSFAGNASGVALEYKLIATDARVSMQQTERRKSMMRELRLAYNIWEIVDNDGFTLDELNETEIIFTVGNPGILERQKEMIVALDGIVSDATMAELLASITQVQSNDEIARKSNTIMTQNEHNAN